MGELVKFHASSVGKLMVGREQITPNQLQRLEELAARKVDPDSKPLTKKMEQELADLILKRDADFKFGATALSYIREVWLKHTYGYDEPVVTNEILKGHLCEDASIGVLTRQVEGGYRVKNDEHFEDEHFVGTPDILLPEWVEDVKSSWTLKTFVSVKKVDPLYFSQLQVYMALTGKRKARLAHILVDTPPEIVEEEKKKYYFRFNCDESDPNYLEAVAKVDAMHEAARKVPEPQRIKFFEFGYNQKHVDELRNRVDKAREVFNEMSLGD